MIISKNLCKSFYEAENKEHVIFRGLDVEIAKHEFVIIFGASGSGKSTFLNLVSGIDDIDSGDLIISDINLTKISDEEKTLFRRKNVGFIFQNFNLIPTLTVEENILLPLELNGMYEKEYIDFALGMLKTVGLINKRNSFPEKLSGGEQQRVALVRALAHKPAIVLADEPTGNLDAETADVVMNLLQTLREEYSPTTIIVSHNRELAKYADKVLCLKNKNFIVEESGDTKEGQDASNISL
ncbi:MAG: ABC transporter ATP-binding protein [Candidatus Caenarcaniphilales bacterium]|nr:ABC transporter ATP-binding protein [Candidatus Caenarcaniphilales bacterium]